MRRGTSIYKGENAVAGDQRPEESQVEGEAEAVEQQEGDSGRGSGRRSAGVDGVEDQQQDAGKTESDSAGFFHRNRLFQKEIGEEHCEDGTQGAHNGDVDGGGHRDGHQEGELRNEKARDGGGGNLREVAPTDGFFREEKGYQPKEEAGTEGSQSEKDDGGNDVGVGDVLAGDDVESEDGVGTGHGEVSAEFVSPHWCKLS